MDFEEALPPGLVQWVDDAVVDRFLDEVAAQSVKPEDARATRKLRIVYTPLNGTGARMRHADIEACRPR